MFRVARPGSKIIVSDETEMVVAGTYRRIPFVNRFFRERTAPVISPTDLLPAAAQGISLSTVNRGKLYCLTFRK
jgi:hypothetical protein